VLSRSGIVFHFLIQSNWLGSWLHLLLIAETGLWHCLIVLEGWNSLTMQFAWQSLMSWLQSRTRTDNCQHLVNATFQIKRIHWLPHRSTSGTQP